MSFTPFITIKKFYAISKDLTLDMFFRPKA